MQLKDHIGYNEKIVWEGGKSPKITAMESILNPMLLLSIIYLLMMGCVAETLQSSGAVTSIVIILYLVPIVMYGANILKIAIEAKNTYYIITDQNIYIQKGILSLITETKPLNEYTHISVHQGVVDRLFGTGDIIIECVHESTTSFGEQYHGLNICNIEEYEEVFNLLKDIQIQMYATNEN